MCLLHTHTQALTRALEGEKGRFANKLLRSLMALLSIKGQRLIQDIACPCGPHSQLQTICVVAAVLAWGRDSKTQREPWGDRAVA